MKFDPIRIAKGARPGTPNDEKQDGRRKRKIRVKHPRSFNENFESDDEMDEGLNINGTFRGTVVYVHGIANKPKASVLKCQWDRALFGTGMGQRTRMVYWVNRDRYPDPYPATCNDDDLSEGVDLGGDQGEETLVDGSREKRLELAELQAQELMEVSDAREREKKKIFNNLYGLADSLEENIRRGSQPGQEMHAEILPLPQWARDRLTRMFTRLLLNDVYDYFFDSAKASEIDSKFWSRLSGGGPFVVVGHSLGSVIAYKNLCNSKLKPGSVPLFLTLGSPLGFQEVQDNLKESLNIKKLAVPDCVTNWVNLSDRLDPVAIDARLSNDFEGSICDLMVKNIDRPRHPHSATGYLGLSECQEKVRQVVGAAFAQPIMSFSIARDLTDAIEDSLTMAGDDETLGQAEAKHSVLIELQPQADNDLDAACERLLLKIESAIEPTPLRSIKWLKLRRYLAANLTSWQVEKLGPILKQEKAGRIWNDSEKMTLTTSTRQVPREDPIQSAAAARVYGADGAGIHWAVLDTGVQPDHPHFQTHDNIESMWDCTHTEPEIVPPDFDIDPFDKHGHGTHVAGIVAGVVTPASGDKEARNGVAAKTKLHSYKVLDSNGRGRDSNIIRALDHIARVNESASSLVIHGVNLSLGGPFDPETYGCGHSPVCRELRRLWRQGVLIVVAAGNAGFAELQSSRGSLRANLDLSIGDPANLEEAIAVGSVHLANPLTYGTSFFSSRGPTADGRQKPDLVAPGERIRSANYAYQQTEDYIELSGTSMAAPHVSGLLAAFLSQRRELIGEPDMVKSILLENATDLNRDAYVQGAGLPNLVKMLLST